MNTEQLNLWDQILEQLLQLEISEKRTTSEGYFEAVLISRDLSKWFESLAQHLGPAFKPTGEAPAQAAKEVAAPYGGIRKDQTLFYKTFEDFSLAAMFWPWGNGESITLKMWLIQSGQ